MNDLNVERGNQENRENNNDIYNAESQYIQQEQEQQHEQQYEHQQDQQPDQQHEQQQEQQERHEPRQGDKKKRNIGNKTRTHNKGDKPKVDPPLICNKNIEKISDKYSNMIDQSLLDEIAKIYNNFLNDIKIVIDDDELPENAKKQDISTRHKLIESKIRKLEKSVPELHILARRLANLEKSSTISGDNGSSSQTIFKELIKPFPNSNPFETNNKGKYLLANMTASIMTDGSDNNISEYYKSYFSSNIDDVSSEHNIIINYLPIYCFLLDQLINKDTIDLKMLWDIDTIDRKSVV